LGNKRVRRIHNFILLHERDDTCRRLFRDKRNQDSVTASNIRWCDWIAVLGKISYDLDLTRRCGLCITCDGFSSRSLEVPCCRRRREEPGCQRKAYSPGKRALFLVWLERTDGMTVDHTTRRTSRGTLHPPGTIMEPTTASGSRKFFSNPASGQIARSPRGFRSFVGSNDRCVPRIVMPGDDSKRG